MAATGKYQVDMCHGPLFSKIVVFAIPLMLSMGFQLIFHAMDLVVIGHFSPHEAMAAVGSTAPINSLMINVFGGLAVGTSVFTGRFFGADDRKRLSRAIHTSIALGVYGGIIAMLLGVLIVRPLLMWMETPADVLPKACLYQWICFAGLPFSLLFNIGSGIMRAVGDTKRPFYFLTAAGVVNVLLNLFFVVVCGMDVAGVAIATAIAHALSAGLLLRALMKNEPRTRFSWHKMRIDWRIMKDILKIGVPSGIQSSFFAVSNMIIQSSINSFGSYAMAGSTAELGVESILHVCSTSFYHAAIAFISQNRGAGDYRRMVKSIQECVLCATILCTIVGWAFYLLGPRILGIFNSDPKVIDWAMQRAAVMFTTYMLLGIMETLNGTMRALGYALSSMFITLFFACIFRIWWIFTILPDYRSFFGLFISYPVSWVLVSAVNLIVLYFGLRKLKKELAARQRSLA